LDAETRNNIARQRYLKDHHGQTHQEPLGSPHHTDCFYLYVYLVVEMRDDLTNRI
jgi:hypothetical protein